jgi:hypothetical protein
MPLVAVTLPHARTASRCWSHGLMKMPVLA